MKCQVCDRRMRSGDRYFECSGCGATAAFPPVEPVPEEKEERAPEVNDAPEPDEDPAETEPVRHTPRQPDPGVTKKAGRSKKKPEEGEKK